MSSSSAETGRRKQFMGAVGTLLLLAVLVVKLSRYLELQVVSPGVGGVLPSLLGPGGLLLLVRSGTGRLSRLSLFHTAVLVGAVAVGLEVAQLIPRPGPFARVRYTFDGLDLAASLVSVLGGYFLAQIICRHAGPDARG